MASESGGEPDIKIIKRKLTGFFKPKDKDIIKEAIKNVHYIITNTSILFRTYYLDWFEKHRLDNDILIIDKNILNLACRVVQGEVELKTRNNQRFQDKRLDKASSKSKNVDIEKLKEQEVEMKKTSSDHFIQMVELYNEMYSDLDIPSDDTKLSLSHILSYSLENLLTAYENNVSFHFTKYPKKYIICKLVSEKKTFKEAKYLAGKIIAKYFYDSADVEISEDIDIERFNFLFPNKQKVDKPRCYEIQVYPWIYLKKMVEINSLLESSFKDIDEKYRKLLNPLPYHNSFIPNHIRLDTSGLCHLLMSKEKIDKFKTWYEIEHPNETLNMKTKIDMLSSFEKIFGRKPSSKREEGLFSIDLWTFITNLKSCKQWKEINNIKIHGKTWVFDNSILTDGVSISFQVSNNEIFGKKCRTFNKNKPKKDKESQIIDFKIFDTSKKFLGNDPGKKDILALTDGFKTIKYTRGLRKQETLQHTRTLLSLKKRRKENLEEYETTILSQFSSKSCYKEEFIKYARARKLIEEKALTVYNHPMYRQFKFLVFTKTKSSEDKFADKIRRSFAKSSEIKPCVTDEMKQNNSRLDEKLENAKNKYNVEKDSSKKQVSTKKKKPSEKKKYNRHQKYLRKKAIKDKIKDATDKDDISRFGNFKDFIIGWGNWGKSPNLKGTDPSPGIGIRRKMSNYFTTVTINEHLTSQTCPCCRQERCLKNPEIKGITRHHLLRCTNDKCNSRWWNRNVVGSFNILDKFLKMSLRDETLKNGCNSSDLECPTMKINIL